MRLLGLLNIKMLYTKGDCMLNNKVVSNKMYLCDVELLMGEDGPGLLVDELNS